MTHERVQRKIVTRVIDAIFALPLRDDNSPRTNVYTRLRRGGRGSARASRKEEGEEKRGGGGGGGRTRGPSPLSRTSTSVG